MIPTKDIVANGTPEGWRTVPFWSLFRREKRTGFPEEELLSVYRDYGVIPKSSRDDNFNKPSEDLSGYQLVTEGALVTNKMKAWQGSIAISRHQGIVSPAYYVYTPQSDEWDQFLHYLLRSDPYIGLYGRISKGVRVNQWDLEHEALRNIPVLLPDLATQRRIADFLDRETARIDLLIEKKQRLVALLGEKRAAVIIDASTGQANRRYAADDGGVMCATSQHNAPASWDRSKIKFHLSDFFGGGTPSKDNLDYWTDGTIPWVTPKDMKRRFIDAAEDLITVDAVKNSATNMVPSNSVLMVVRSGILKHSLPVGLNTVPVAMNQDMKAFRFRSSLLPEFFVYWIEGHQKQKLLEWCQIGATVDNINVDAMLNGQITVPDLATQRQITDFLDRETARITTVQERTNASIARLKEYRSALITAAVTGQIDVTTYAKSGSPDRRLDAIQEEMGA